MNEREGMTGSFKTDDLEETMIKDKKYFIEFVTEDARDGPMKMYNLKIYCVCQRSNTEDEISGFLEYNPSVVQKYSDANGILTCPIVFRRVSSKILNEGIILVVKNQDTNDVCFVSERIVISSRKKNRVPQKERSDKTIEIMKKMDQRLSIALDEINNLKREIQDMKSQMNRYTKKIRNTASSPETEDSE